MQNKRTKAGVKERIMANGDPLLAAIKEHGGDDVVIPYWDIARLFPSVEPHLDSFEYKSVDKEELLQWAADNRFEVSILADQAPENAPKSPPYRFRKL